MNLTGLAGRILNTPLAIWPAKGDAILHVLGPRLGLAIESAAPVALQGSEQSGRDGLAMTDDGIAVVDVSGTLVRKDGWINALSGLTSYSSLQSDFLTAANDPDCKAILMLLDSPGGEVGGLFDLCDKLKAIGKQKPIYGAVSEMACSAGYALAACCSKIFITQTAAVGSIGCYALHVDQSAADKKAGLRYTYIKYGARKAEGNTHEPLSTSAEESIQKEIDRVGDMFVALVAESRGITARAVKATEAGVYFAEDAIRLKLADVIGTPEAALAALRSAVNPNQSTVQMSRTSNASEPASYAAVVTERISNTMNNPIDQAQLAAAATDRINGLCLIAGRPDLLSGFLSQKLTPEAVQDELLKLASDESAKHIVSSRFVSRTKSAVMTGIQGIRQMLSEAHTVASQSGYSGGPKRTKEQVFSQMLTANPEIYAQYKSQKQALIFRHQAGDPKAAEELLSLNNSMR